jgi:hypothetical protein
VWIPWSIIHISLYEQAKRTLKQLLPDQQPSGSSAPATLGSLEPGQPDQLIGLGQGAAGQVRSLDSVHPTAVTQPAVTSPSQELASGAEPGQLPPWVLGWCSAGAAAVATVLTHPADVVKTRLQVLSGLPSASGPRALTALQVARTTLAQEGPKVGGWAASRLGMILVNACNLD